jgi:hypothetical protein
MINVTNKILKAWHELLNGNLSVPVYRLDAPISEDGNYVLLRVESDTDVPNNHKWVSTPVIISEVVTRFATITDDSMAGDIDSEIAELLYDSPSQHNLPSQDGVQIVSVKRRDQTYLPEDDGSNRYLRLIVRNVHRVEQIIEQS